MGNLSSTEMSSTRYAHDLMGQVVRLQDQVKEIQHIVKLQVPDQQVNLGGNAAMDETNVENNPYSRLMRLNRTSAVNNYETVQALSVAIIGIGGIGGVVAEMLTRSGVGKLWLIDKGTVDPTHLNRMLFRPEHVGLSKTQAAKATLAGLNSHVAVETFAVDILAAGAVELVEQRLEMGGLEGDEPVDMIISCLDNRDARLIVHQIRQNLGRPWFDAGTFPDGLSGCVQYMPEGTNCLEFAIDLADQGTGFQPSMATTTSILGGIVAQNCLKLHLKFGVLPRYTGMNTMDNSCTMEPPKECTPLV